MAEKMDWQPINSAPKDGRDIEIRTFDGFEMPAKWEPRGFMNEAGEDCGAWVASEEGNHPPCWSDGVCWESNEDEVQSDQPAMWRPTP